MPTISVIVPVYNAEKYLHQCIASILAQSFPDFELILVDDGSIDQSGAICEEYASVDSRICVIHKENEGVSIARNSGLKIASGKYVAFCDSDDSLEMDFLERLFTAIEASSADSVVSSFDRIYPDGTIEPERRLILEGYVDLKKPEEKEEYVLKQILRWHVGWEATTRLFRRDIIEKHHIRFCENCENFAEDLGFVLKFTLFSSGEISINYRGYKYYQRSNSMMANSKSAIKLNAVNEISKFVYPSFSSVFSEFDNRLFTVFHAEVLYNQLNRLLSKNNNVALDSFRAVKDQRWMKKNLAGILRYRKILIKYCGEQTAWRIILFSHFAIHQTTFLFRVERSFINRFIIYDV